MSSTTRVGVVIVAAGSGQRFGSDAKVLAPIAGRPMLAYSLELFSSIEAVRQIVVVAGEHSIDRIHALVASMCPGLGETCLGGATRRESVQHGFGRISHRVDLVAVHDAARPLAGERLVRSLIEQGRLSGAAVPALPVSDTVYRVGADGSAMGIADRDCLRLVQTPQVARRDWLAAALEQPGEFTDEGSALLATGYPVSTVDGSAENIKITWPDDIVRAEEILARGSRS